MPVTRLRTRRDAGRKAALEAVRDMLRRRGRAPQDRRPAFVERELAARRGWRFVMVEPRLYADVVEHLSTHSQRPQKAVLLFTRLFSYLPPDGNEVLADREELARVVGSDAPTTSRRSWASWRPWAPSTAAGRAAASGTSSTRCSAPTSAGAARDKAQAEAPPLSCGWSSLPSSGQGPARNEPARGKLAGMNEPELATWLTLPQLAQVTGRHIGAVRPGDRRRKQAPS